MNFEGISIDAKAAGLLSSAVAAHRLPHAAVIEGGSESDRLALARLLARAEICSGAQPPCGECSDCKKALAGFHPDITQALAVAGDAAPLQVASIRQMRSDAYVFPNEAHSRVFLLHNLQLSSEQAQNALLKILEEPPEYVRFIITCPSSTSLLPTVLSRTAVFNIGRQSDDAQNDKYEAACSCAAEIAAALTSPNEFDLMRATAALEKDSQLFSLVLVQLRLVLRDALVRRQSPAVPPLSHSGVQAQALSRTFTVAQLIAMNGAIDELEENTARNANKSLLVTRLCSLLRRAAGR